MFIGEMMAKEDINGCDEVGMSDASIQDLNDAKWTYALKKSLDLCDRNYVTYAVEMRGRVMVL